MYIFKIPNNVFSLFFYLEILIETTLSGFLNLTLLSFIVMDIFFSLSAFLSIDLASKLKGIHGKEFSEEYVSFYILNRVNTCITNCGCSALVLEESFFQSKALINKKVQRY